MNCNDSTGIAVDTQGVQILQSQVSCEVAGRAWDFILDEDRKRKRAFHFGLFVNNAAYSRRAGQYPRSRRICALFESPINPCYRDVDYLAGQFPIVFTHQRDLLDLGAPFVRLMFGTNWISVRTQADADEILAHHPRKTALVSFVGSLAHANNGAYAFRREVAEYVQARGDVECFGKGIREIPGKRSAIEPYRFSIAMENAAQDHYFSEKLVDCILLESIPIYYGCPGIGDLLDPRGLLTFNSRDELAHILSRLSPQLYQELRPFALANKSTLIEEGWHSHRTLFVRIARLLPQLDEFTVGQPVRRRSKLRQWLRP